MSDKIVIDPGYLGPDELPSDVTRALSILAKTLAIESNACKTHSIARATQFDDDCCLEATAIYLVSTIAQSIEANLKIRAALFDEKSLSRELRADVVAVVGENCEEVEFKTMRRNPWMWEGISHMLIHLSREVRELHPVGNVLAKTSVKHDVNDHGLDLIAIYDSGSLGITAGECKAYLKNPTDAIGEAAQKLSEVDLNTRDIEIRAAINQLRTSLEPLSSGRLAGCFWKDERTYIPFVCCNDADAIDWNRNRLSLKKLAVPVSKKILVPLVLPSVSASFDRICEYMREYASYEGP